jgi:hypothetical protein
MCLVGESALQRYVAQGRFSLQHVFSRQLDATPDHEGVRCLSEGTPEGTREIPFAELNERTQIRHSYPIRDMTINVGTHSARVPGGQAALSGESPWRELGVDLHTQQRNCIEYRAVSHLLLIDLICSRIEERHYLAHARFPHRGPTHCCFPPD